MTHKVFPVIVAAATAKATCEGSKVNFSCLPDPGSVQNGSFISTLLTLAIGVVAAISVLFVAIGGLRYVFSQGDPQAAAKAKGTIIYALIGLAVAIIAQGIVIFVVKQVT